MIKQTWRYVLPSLKNGQFPFISRRSKSKIVVAVNDNWNIDIVGNRIGLLYLAKFIVAMALIRNKEGLHIHLNSDNYLDAGSVEVTIKNTDFCEDKNTNNKEG